MLKVHDNSLTCVQHIQYILYTFTEFMDKKLIRGDLLATRTLSEWLSVTDVMKGGGEGG